MIQQISTFCNISQWIDANTLSFWSIIIGLIGIITTILAIFGFKIVLPHTRNWRKEQIEDIPDAFWGYYPNKNYIQPYFTFVDTRDNNPQLLRDYFLKKVFIKDTAEPKIYCLLGDTGTGKTAALVHLYADYIHSHSAKSPYHIKILSLREDKAFEKIDEIQDKKRCILLLDAMDESPMAQNSTQRSDFDKAINEVCKNFAFVIITCRPQFFSDDKTESEKVRVQKGYEWFPYTRLRLSDFNNIQVQEYLDNVFPSKTDCHLHQKAAKLVNKNAFIAIRPLVLTYIKDIIESKNEINTTLDLYDTIVQRWIQRELKRTNPDNLKERRQLWWNLTSEIAQYIYLNRTSKYKAPNITEDELISICKKQGSINFKVILSSRRIASDASPLTILNEENIHQRTMLTRTGDLFHFSHKSFYEYFMAYRFFLYPDEIKRVSGMDFALKFYDELKDAYFENHSVQFANLREIDRSTIAKSLYNIGYSVFENHQYSQAEPFFNDALNMFGQIAGKKNKTYGLTIAKTLYYLAVIHVNQNRLKEAEANCNESISLFQELNIPDPNIYFNVLLFLADIHLKTKEYNTAEKEYDELLQRTNLITDFYQEEENKKYIKHNLFVIHLETDEITKAILDLKNIINDCKYLVDFYAHDYGVDSLEFYSNYDYIIDQQRCLLEIKNDEFELSSLAFFLFHYNDYIIFKDEQKYEEALHIYRQLSEVKPDLYIPSVIDTLLNLAKFCYNSDTNKKEQSYIEAISLLRNNKQLDLFLPKMAEALFDLASFYFGTKQDSNQAKNHLEESINIYRMLNEINDSDRNYSYSLEKAEELLERIRKAKEAEE